MSIFAEINSGVVTNVAVAEAVANLPAGTWVQLDTITPRPGIGWAYNGSTFTGPTPPAPALAQQGASLINGGLTITSTGTPALDGVYTVADSVPFGRQDIANEAQFVGSFQEFTNGGTTLAWPLLSGAMVTFPTTSEFMAFAKAVAQFRAAVQAAVVTNGTLPAASVTIP